MNEVIEWLRSPEGERWSRARMPGSLVPHDGDDGVFATVLDGAGFPGSAVSWPEPEEFYDLGAAA